MEGGGRRGHNFRGSANIPLTPPQIIHPYFPSYSISVLIQKKRNKKKKKKRSQMYKDEKSNDNIGTFT